MKLAVIGAGNRLCGMLAGMCGCGVQLAAVADPRPDIVRARLKEQGVDFANTLFVDSANKLIDQSDRFDGFAIGTRCNLHTPFAIEVAQANKPLFLEKPVAISQEQLESLGQAWKSREDQVVVSFPLRVTPAFATVRDIVRSGRLGMINQIQAVNNVPYGDVYFEEWYRRFSEVGGLWLQKATHDFDYLNQLVGARPVRIAAMMTQRVFGTGAALEPDRPPNTETSPIDKHKFVQVEEDITDRDADLSDVGSRFHAGIRNQDAGSAIIWYDNGVVVSYNQNFVSRNTAGKRGAVVTGYNGTLSWDWQPSPEIQVIDHHSTRVDRISLPTGGNHSGGDALLYQKFIDLMRGKPNSAGNLKDGLLSVAMCLAARKAAQHHSVQDIPDLGIYPSSDSKIDPSNIEA